MRRLSARIRVLPSAIAAVIMLVSHTAAAADQRLPVKVRIAIIFKTLTYDLNLKSRCPKGLRIGVVGRSGSESSMSVARETIEEIKANAGKRVKGLSISVKQLTVSGMVGVKRAVEEQDLNLLYLSPGISSLLEPIIRYAKQNNIVLLTGESEYVKAGAAVGAVLRDKKPKILVHLRAAGEQGAKFDARLLRLVEVVK
jgi:ABC-type uncharacterized transport system substrate-binding protein